MIAYIYLGRLLPFPNEQLLLVSPQVEENLYKISGFVLLYELVPEL